MSTRVAQNFGASFAPSGLSNLVGPVPAGQTWSVSMLDLYNTSAAAVTLTLYIKTAGVSIAWKGCVLGAGESAAMCDKALELNAGQVIQSVVSVANVVTYVASGVVES